MEKSVCETHSFSVPTTKSTAKSCFAHPTAGGIVAPGATGKLADSARAGEHSRPATAGVNFAERHGRCVTSNSVPECARGVGGNWSEGHVEVAREIRSLFEIAREAVRGAFAERPAAGDVDLKHRGHLCHKVATNDVQGS